MEGSLNAKAGRLPAPHGLYDPQFEHDACGVGFVADIKGRKSHDIVEKALGVLLNLSHRGATGSDPETGDGAGILVQIPHAFFQTKLKEQGVDLPEPGHYGVGALFLPQDPAERSQCEAILERILREEGQSLIAWRDVPVDSSSIGRLARSVEPCIRQLFIGRGANADDDSAFERKLYCAGIRAG